jgi:hypothetical protein
MRIATRRAPDPRAQAMPLTVHEALASPGYPLEAGVRTSMGSRFGHDFADLRVHTSPVAAQSARDLDARAYTVGRHVFFAAGRYQPATPAGQRLLAHELAHAVHAPRAGGLRPMRPIKVAPANSEGELAAERAAEITMRSPGTCYDVPAMFGAAPTEGYVHRQREDCPTCHSPRGVREVQLIPKPDPHDVGVPFPDAEARAFAAELAVAKAKFHDQDLMRINAVQVYLYENVSVIAGYVLNYNNPLGTSFPQATVAIDAYGNELTVSYSNPEALVSVMPPWEWINLARLGGRLALGTARKLGSAFTSSALGSSTRSFLLANRLAGAPGARWLAAGMRGLDEFAPGIGAGGATALRPTPTFVMSEGGEGVVRATIPTVAPSQTVRLLTPTVSSEAARAAALPAASARAAGTTAALDAARAAGRNITGMDLARATARLTAFAGGATAKPPTTTSPALAPVTAPPPSFPPRKETFEEYRQRGGVITTVPEGQSGTTPKTPMRLSEGRTTARPTGARTPSDVDVTSQPGMRRQSKAYPAKPQHHVFPQELRSWFEERFKGTSENIHDYTVYLSEGEHQAIHKSGKGGVVKGVQEADLKGWNQEWKDFKRDNPTAPPQMIFEEAGRLMDRYKISGEEIARYKGKK